MSNIVNQKELWEEKALTYPSFKKNGKLENLVLDKIENYGFKFKDNEILDVGCGSGIYTLNMALRGAKLTGLDISSNMLEKLKISAQNEGLEVKTILNDFPNFAKENEKKFDIVTSFMSPAINSYEAKEALFNIPKKGFVTLGWNSRSSSIGDEVFKKYGVKKDRIRQAVIIKDMIKSKNLDFKNEIIADSWSKTLDLEDTLDKQLWHLKTNKVFPPKDELREFLKGFCDEEGNIKDITNFKLELIICKF